MRAAANVRRALASSWLSLFCGVAVPVWAAPATDPCQFAGSFEDYVNALLGQQPARNVNAEEVTESAGEAEARKRPDGDGLSEAGIDRFKKLFVALGLGSVEGGDRQLVFNLRPDLLDFDALGSGSLRAVVREPELFGKVTESLEALPESSRAARRDELESLLEEGDDVEYQLRWEIGESAAKVRAKRIARATFDFAYADVQAEYRSAAEALNELQSSLTDRYRTGFSVSALCAEAASRGDLDRTRAIVAGIESTNARLEHLLGTQGFTVIADLLENDPVFALEALYNDRETLVGPDVGSVKLRFQIGDRSLWGWRRRGSKSSGDEVPSFLDYVSATGGKGKRMLTLSAEYRETAQYRFELPGEAVLVELPRARVLAATLGVSQKLPGDRSRVDLVSTYEDATGDPERNSRFVTTLSWTQKLSDELAKLAGGSNLAVSAVYSNRPEYRGDVDEELGLRAGLKWSIDGSE